MKYADYFKAVPVLETDRLLLRPFTREDMAAYLPIASDPEVLRYTGDGLQKFPDEEAVTRWLDNINGRVLQSKLAFTWCIEEKASGRVIGRIDLGGFNRRSMGELSYHLARASWRQGFATEAARAVVDFGLNQLLLHRIQAFVMPENTGSLKVLEKVGFVQEGVLQRYRFGNEFQNTVILAIVNEKNLSIKK